MDIVFNGIGIRPSQSQYGTPATVISYDNFLKAIDPTRGKGADLQDLIMKCTRTAIGEIAQK